MLDKEHIAETLPDQAEVFVDKGFQGIDKQSKARINMPMKKPKHQELSPEQKEVLDKLTNIGYYAVCCFGSEDAIKVINEYFAEYLELKKKLRLKEIFKNKID